MSMNDLPQDELFSAYLDGELTAAEQAEMERLLATSPAARQLLDELRTLSMTLQSLPQQKVGEDLGPQVLRVAERRMLTEDGPGDGSDAPVPLARLVFRRFVGGRTLVWLALTLAVAVMITINDRRRQLQPAADMDKEIARAPAIIEDEAEDEARKPGPPPSIHAPPSMTAQTEKRESAADKKENGLVKPVQIEKLEGLDTLVLRGSPEDVEQVRKIVKNVEKTIQRKEEAPAALRSDKVVTSGPAEAKTGQVAEKAATREPGYGFGVTNMKTGGNVAGAAPAAPILDRSRTPDDRLAELKGKSALPSEEVLVVKCDISPETARKQAFDKLLYANGITWQETRNQVAPAGQSRSVANRMRRADDLKQQRAPLSDAPVPPATAAGEVDFVYVEATPAQITNTVRGLSEQPSVFRSVSTIPGHDEAAQNAIVPEVVRQQMRPARQEASPSLPAWGKRRRRNRPRLLPRSPSRTKPLRTTKADPVIPPRDSPGVFRHRSSTPKAKKSRAMSPCKKPRQSGPLWPCRDKR